MGCGPSKYRIHAEQVSPQPGPAVSIRLLSSSSVSNLLLPTASPPPPPRPLHALNLRTHSTISPSHASTDREYDPRRSSTWLPPSPHPLSSAHSHPSQTESRSSSLLSIARALAAETRLSHIVHIIVTQVPELIDCDRCTLFFVDRETKELIARRSGSGGRRKTFVSWVFGQMEAPALPFGEGEDELRLPMKGLAGVVAMSGQCVKLDDVHLDGRFDPSMDKETGYRTRSMLCVPMVDNKGECIGVIQAINKNPVYPGFDSADEALLLTFSAQAALAVRNSQLLSKTSAALQQADALLEITNVLSSELKMEALIAMICSKLQQLLGCERCTVFLVDKQKAQLYTSASLSYGMGPSAVVSGDKDREKLLSFPINRGIAGHVATTGEVVNLPDAYEDARFDRTVDNDTGYRTKSVLCVPVKNHRAEVVGVIQVINKQKRTSALDMGAFDDHHHHHDASPATHRLSHPSPGHLSKDVLPPSHPHRVATPRVIAFSSANVRLLTAFSSQAAVAIENSRLFTETEKALNQALAEQRNLRFMLSVTKNLFSDLHLQSTLGQLVQQIQALMKADHCVFYLVDQQSRDYYLAKEHASAQPAQHKDKPRRDSRNAAHAPLSARFPFTAGFAGRVITSGEPLRINADADKDPAFEAAIDARHGAVPQSILYCPVIGTLVQTPTDGGGGAGAAASGPAVLGVIGVWDGVNRGGFAADEEELLRAFCAQASAAITSSNRVSSILLQSEAKDSDDSAAQYLKGKRGMKLASHKIDRFEYRTDDLAMKGLIGVGSYGEVYRAVVIDTQQTVAVKRFHVRQLQAEQVDSFCSEASLMCQLTHPNVVGFIGAITEPSNLAIITEFCSRGSVADILVDDSVQLTFAQRVRIALDAARGMHYLHTSNPVILHRDLKSDNLLVTDAFVIKVGDFGLTRFLSEGKQMTQVGTPMWMAPEIIQGRQYTQKADVYAFGIILWEVLTRLEPYEDKEPMQIVLEVVNQQLRPHLPTELHASPMVPLMTECWAQDPGVRPTFQQCVVRLEAILADVEGAEEGEVKGGGKKGWRALTPHGIANVWGVGLGALDKGRLPSFARREEERQEEMRRTQAEAEREEREEFDKRQQEREEQLRQEREDDEAEQLQATSTT